MQTQDLTKYQAVELEQRENIPVFWNLKNEGKVYAKQSYCLVRYLCAIILIFLCLPFVSVAKGDIWATGDSLPYTYTVVGRGIHGIVIDGSFSDWSFSENVLSIGGSTWEALAGGSWEGENDLSAELRIAYDQDSLYFALLVRDDEYVAECPHPWPWENDGIQIAIDSSAGQIPPGWPNATTRLYNFSIKDGWHREISSFPYEFVAEDAEIYMVRDEDVRQTLYEWRMTGEMIGDVGTEFGPGMEIAFAIVINDSDEDAKGQGGWIGWGSRAITYGKNPELMKTLTLAEVGIIYVDDDNTTGPWDGTPDHPYAVIQDGIDVAADDYTVLVADGLYVGPGNMEIDFKGKAIRVKSENGYNNCIIDCQDEGHGIIFQSGEMQNSVIEGFTIRNVVHGIHCVNSSSPTIRYNLITDSGGGFITDGPPGGGIFCSDSSPLIVGNSIRNAVNGIRCVDSSSPTIRNNLITDSGGGFGSGSPPGGGISCSDSSPLIVGNSIQGNESYQGGGISCHSCCAIIMDNVISDNRVGGTSSSGGGIFCQSGDLQIIGNVIHGNSTGSGGGGGIVLGDVSAVLVNNVITRNSGGPGWGGGIQCGNSDIEVVNNTIVHNSDAGGGGIVLVESSLVLVNSIVWSEYEWAIGYWPTQIMFSSGGEPSSASISHSVIAGGEEGVVTNKNGTLDWLEGNMGSHPLFVDDANDDYHLSLLSPCIGAGAITPNVLDTDIEGNMRPNPPGSNPDIGAYESNLSEPLSRPPIADDQSVTTDEDTAASITLTGSDPDGDSLTYTVLSNPSNGLLTGTPPALIYTPSLDFSGSDSFTFKVSDAFFDSNTATVSITVLPVNDPPVAHDESVITDEDTSVSFSLTSHDVDGGTYTYYIVSSPTNGSLTGIAPNLTYIPNPNFNGNDSFTFSVYDGSDDSNTATVSIIVNPVNDPPVAEDQSVATDEDIPVDITLTGSDVDGDLLSYAVISIPSNGTLTGFAWEVTYTPDADFNGSDSFTFRTHDGFVSSNIATVGITVNPINDPPTSQDQLVATDEDTAVNITLIGNDVDSDLITYHIVSSPMHGFLTGTAPAMIYVPNISFTGMDSFTYRVNDGKLDSDVATVKIIVGNAEGFFSCNMYTGWNLISLPLYPPGIDPSTILFSINGKYNSVWAYDPDAGWSIYAPGAPSDLEEIVPCKGYWIKMDEPATLVVQGTVPESTAILLRGGKWNLVGYSSLIDRRAEDCMSSVADSINSVWEYNPTTGWAVYVPGGPSNLIFMRPGYGYWIKANEDCTWDISEANP